jgi:hypothetical protein
MDRPHYYATARNSENVCPLLRVTGAGRSQRRMPFANPDLSEDRSGPRSEFGLHCPTGPRLTRCGRNRRKVIWIGVRVFQQGRIRGFGISTGVPRCGNSENCCPPLSRRMVDHDRATPRVLASPASTRRQRPPRAWKEPFGFGLETPQACFKVVRIQDSWLTHSRGENYRNAPQESQVRYSRKLASDTSMGATGPGCASHQASSSAKRRVALRSRLR